MNPSTSSMADLKKRFEDDHQHPVNRALHRVGFVFIASGVVSAPFRPLLGLSLVGVGYLTNFVGHWIEGTVPVLFRDPRAMLLGAQEFGAEVSSLLRRGSAPKAHDRTLSGSGRA